MSSVIRTCFLVLLMGLLAACAPSILRAPVPEPLVDNATVIGMDDIRYWGDSVPANLEEILREKAAQIKIHPRNSRDWSILALSGGGADGAFGAGVLVGWSETGTRPLFEAVTGISTGALIAPFAFLGPKYDARLKEAFTNLSTNLVLKTNILAGILGGSALADTTGLARIIAKFTPPEMFAEIAAEYRKGRYLLIGTTNLDAQRPVVWNIGALANSGHPKALQLFRKIIRASAAIPGAFPPVVIDVEVDGKRYNELHVDGGVTTQVFLFPAQMRVGAADKLLGFKPNRRIYVIRNSKITPEYKGTEAAFFGISGRSISTLIKSQGIGDLFRIYVLARRDRMDYNLAYIPPYFTVKSNEPFDKKYMRALYDLGYRLAREGYPWLKVPPEVDDKKAIMSIDRHKGGQSPGKPPKAASP